MNAKSKACVKTILLLVIAFVYQATNDTYAQKPEGKVPHVLFLISEDPDNYKATTTIPVFAGKLKEQGYRTTVLLGEGERGSFRFPGMDVISDVDLVVVFCRRVALPREQLQMLKDYLKQGKPLIGIRTAHHAFSPREQIGEGHEAWQEFPAEILGCENRGYGPEKVGIDVSVVPSGKNHFITKKIRASKWRSEGNIYHVAPLLDPKATILLSGKSNDKTEPIAWTRIGDQNNRIFYTSLGYPTDFNNPQFNELLVNGIKWTLGLTRR